MADKPTDNANLRPTTFDEYIGQESAVNSLRVFLKAVKERGYPTEHVLFYGPPGIGKTTATAIIAELPEIQEFQDARQMAAFLGLTPSHKTSGSSVRFKSRISKMGSGILRKALYWPAIVAKSHNPILKHFSEKLKRKGKHNMVIIIAVMRKLLHIIYGVLKHKTSFNPSLGKT